MQLLISYVSNPIEYWPQLLILACAMFAGYSLQKKIQGKKTNSASEYPFDIQEAFFGRKTMWRV